jgi:phage baseplate assembly protein W
MADLKVLIRDPNTGRLRVGMPRPPQYVSGIDLLVQIVATLFMTNGGRSIVVPDRAGGLRDLIGTNIDPEDPSELFADVRTMINMVERQIKEEQVNTSRPPSERLQALQLIDIVPDDEQPIIEIIISVVNEEQQQAQAVVAT